MHRRSCVEACELRPLTFVLTFVLLLAAFVLFALATFGIGHPRVNFVAAGLACWVAVALIAAWPG